MIPSLRARTALGEKLRKARLDAGMTGTELTAKLGSGWGQPKVSKLETGRQLPSEEDLREWADLTGANPDELVALLKRARHEYSTYKAMFAEDGGAAALQDAVAAAEYAAKVIASYQPLLIPGFLQTADYARALLNLPGGPRDSGATPDEIARMIASRMRRSAILYEPSRQITLLIGEGALRNRFAPRGVMRDQLEHIARLAETLTTAVIGIIPFDRELPVLVFNGWDLTDDILAIETPLGDLDISDPSDVARYSDYLKLLLDVAETGADAGRICRELAAQIA